MSLRYVIDGYNLLYALPIIPPGTWEQKRVALLEQLARQSPHGANAMTVVFDSREGQGDRGKHGAIDIVFTAGETADDWISAYVRKSGKARSLVVVTNDRGVRELIRGTGAKWMKVEEFLSHANTSSARPSPARKDELDAITEELKKEWLE